MLSVKNLTKVYLSGGLYKKREIVAVNDVSLSVEKNETLGIIGESGCGKTTLAKLILRLIPATSGSIVFGGINISELDKKSLRKMRKDMQIIFQNPETALNPRMKIYESIAEVLRLNGITRFRSMEERSRISELIHITGLQEEHLSRYPYQLSGGQIQRVVLARVLALSPKLLIADEPTSMLDVSVQAQILSLLKEMQSKLGFACIFISHDLDVVRVMCDRVAVMLGGRIVETGETTKILNDPDHDYTKSLLREFALCPPAGV